MTEPPVAARPWERRRRDVLLPLLSGFVLILYLSFEVFKHFLLTLAVAASVALLLAPVQRRTARAFRGRASLAALLLVVLTTVVILLPVSGYAALLGRQAVAFFEWVRPQLQPAAIQRLLQETVPQRYPWVEAWIDLNEETVPRMISDTLSRTASTANRLIQRAVAGLTSAFVDLALFLLMLFFLLRDGGRLKAELQTISPLSREQEEQIFDHLGRTVKGVMKAMVLVPVAQGLVAFIGFLAFGVPAPALWSVAVVLAALIPLVGSPLGWVPAVAYLFLYGESWQWAGMALWGAVGISGIDNVIKPIILRDSAQIHPLLGFLAILGGLLSFGPLGFLVGPVIVSLLISSVRIYRLDVLRAHERRAEEPAQALDNRGAPLDHHRT
jgi:predicted PurR-regulated permease PerM